MVLRQRKHEPDFSYPTIFNWRNWQKASAEERLRALQQLENEQAAKQGRTPCKIRPDLLPKPGGGFIPDKNIIVVNADHLSSNYSMGCDLFNNSAVKTNYICMDIVLHEGRHAYQHDCVKGKILHHDQDEVHKWKVNFVVYINDYNDVMYKLQPVERDAIYYSLVEMSILLAKIEILNKEPHEYLSLVIKDKVMHKLAAQKKFGPNFLEAIDNYIYQRYLEKRGSEPLSPQQQTPSRHSAK